MMFDLALVTRGNETIGWGHAARMYALATEAARRQLRVVLVTDTPEIVGWLDWPCAVAREDVLHGIRSRVVVYDGVDRSHRDVPGVVMDDGPAMIDGADLVVRPHFGDTLCQKSATLVGPRWMPLGPVRWAHNLDGRILAYRASDATLAQCGPYQGVGGSNELGPWACAVVPPSMIAYECMAAEIPVLLHDDARGHTIEMDAALKRIGHAMIDAGAAVAFSPEALDVTLRSEPGGARSHDMVDGKGAQRLLDYIVEAR